LTSATLASLMRATARPYSAPSAAAYCNANRSVMPAR
jgi:hypothetical protein